MSPRKSIGSTVEWGSSTFLCDAIFHCFYKGKYTSDIIDITFRVHYQNPPNFDRPSGYNQISKYCKSLEIVNQHNSRLYTIYRQPSRPQLHTQITLILFTSCQSEFGHNHPKFLTPIN